MLEGLKNYRSIILDYSFLKEYAGTSLFVEFTDLVSENKVDVYVSKAFKMYHYCVLHQFEASSGTLSNSMKVLCSYLIPDKRLHLVPASGTVEFMNSVKGIENSCILTTKKSIFAKRLYEFRPDFGGAIALCFKNECTIYPSLDEMFEANPKPELSKLAENNKYLDSPFIVSVTDIVTNEDKTKSFELVKRMSGGAEGMVFTTNNRSLVAKIYHKGVITPLRWAKLKRLSQLGITSASFCIPRDLLYFQGVPVGYTMPLGRGTTLGNAFDGPDAILEHFPDWTREDVVDTLVALIEKYMFLHMHDVIAGDIQLKNALINNSSDVYLIDMDSVQVGNLPCPVGTEEFTDPRLWGKNFAGFVRELKDEDYSIAMLVFSILFCGLHPYATRKGAETLREEILGKNFPYTLDNSDEEHIPLGGYNYIWRYLPEKLRTMLYNTFRLGRSYEAIQWYDAVTSYKEELKSRKYTDAEAYKVFPMRSDLAQKETDYTIKPADPKDADADPNPRRYEKRVFNNAPTGRYIPKDQTQTSPFKPISKNGEPDKNTDKPSDDSDGGKKGKLFGLF
ncbi:MAG: hypothetical protein K5745_06180 [Saccharofermentans sp.]|nr:hypothetical protein [Saccharofermentans sp.]